MRLHSGKTEPFTCKECLIIFQRYKKRFPTRSRLAIRSHRCVTCSPDCSKEYTKNYRKRKDTERRRKLCKPIRKRIKE